MANSITQSDTDLLVIADTAPQHEYRGISPIKVDNLYDTVSIEPAAISKIYPTDSINVEQTTNSQGNTIYRLSVDESVEHEYTGEGNIIVDNVNNVIYSDNISFDVQTPLTATIENETLVLGCDLPISNIIQDIYFKTFEFTHSVTSDDITNNYIEETIDNSTLSTWCSSGVITSPLNISVEMFISGDYNTVANVTMTKVFSNSESTLLYRTGFVTGYDGTNTSFYTQMNVTLSNDTFTPSWNNKVKISWPNGISPALNVGKQITIKVRYNAVKLNIE